jgi:hypothetical protein
MRAANLSGVTVIGRVLVPRWASHVSVDSVVFTPFLTGVLEGVGFSNMWVGWDVRERAVFLHCVVEGESSEYFV